MAAHMVTRPMGARATYEGSGARFGDVRRVAETGSTNADLLELARSGAPEGVVIVADHQTGGRGRLGRSWHAAPGSSLLLSVLFRPGLAVGEIFHLTMAVGIAAIDACESVVGLRPKLKWPNDLVVEREGRWHKLAGILAESLVEGDRSDAVVVGLGLNVNWQIVPEDLAADAVSALSLLVGREVDREALLSELLQALEARAGGLDRAAQRQQLRQAYRSDLATLGRRVRVDLPGEVLEGVAVDVSDTGSLLVDVDGILRDVAVGDVVHLRVQD